MSRKRTLATPFPVSRQLSWEYRLPLLYTRQVAVNPGRMILRTGQSPAALCFIAGVHILPPPQVTCAVSGRLTTHDLAGARVELFTKSSFYA